tara:strand:- start:1379 stop:1975 length:597 start_codon:yes stop_codon:yes gene_type:complete
MFLKNEKYLRFLVIVIFLLFSYKSSFATDNKSEVINYLSSLKYFSASFLQNDGENLSEGKIYIGEKRVRAEYFSPSKILIILDENKAMYYNYELEEDEFFNPKKTNAWFFYNIFRNPIFFEDSFIEIKNNELILEKRGNDNEEKIFLIKVYFEKNPLILRAVEIFMNDEFLKLSIYNHSYNEEFEKSFFKLINPKLLN